MNTPASTVAVPAKRTLSPFRLRRHADYQCVYKASRKHFSSSMSYFIRVRPEGEPEASGPRVGLTVGRVMGKAVDRNRIKRRMREAVRLHLGILLNGPHLDLVLHPRKSVAQMEFAVLEKEVARVLSLVASLAAGNPPSGNAVGGSGPGAGQTALQARGTGSRRPQPDSRTGQRKAKKPEQEHR